MTITKQNFQKLFRFFSLIMLINYPLLPFVSSMIGGDKSGCEEGIIFCGIIALIFMSVVGLFWSAIWFINYAIFFMEDQRGKMIKTKLSSLPLLYVRYVQNSCKDKMIQSISMLVVLCLMCFGTIYLLFYELYWIFFI